MLARKQFICLAMLLLAAGAALVQSAVITPTQKVDYITVIDKLKSVGERLVVFKAIWGEILYDGANDLDKVNAFYKNLQSRIKDAQPDEQEQATELEVEVRELLIARNAKHLAETLQNTNSSQVAQVVKFHQALLTTYSEQLLNGIFERAIDIIYPFQSPDTLFALLSSIFKTNTLQNLNLRVHWTLYLYHKFLNLGDVNDAFLYEVANNLFDYKFDTFYKSMSNDTKLRMDLTFGTFPPSLRHLFQTQKVCLSNKKGYYLYFPKDMATTDNKIPVALKAGVAQPTQWYNSYGNQNSPIKGDVVFSAEKSNWFLYRTSPVNDKYKIMAFKSDAAGGNTWEPSLVGDKIEFSKNGFTMCATNDFNVSTMGFDVAAIKKTVANDPNCLWAVTDCSETRY